MTSGSVQEFLTAGPAVDGAALVISRMAAAADETLVDDEAELLRDFWSNKLGFDVDGEALSAFMAQCESPLYRLDEDIEALAEHVDRHTSQIGEAERASLLALAIRVAHIDGEYHPSEAKLVQTLADILGTPANVIEQARGLYGGDEPLAGAALVLEALAKCGKGRSRFASYCRGQAVELATRQRVSAQSLSPSAGTRPPQSPALPIGSSTPSKGAHLASESVPLQGIDVERASRRLPQAQAFMDAVGILRRHKEYLAPEVLERVELISTSLERHAYRIAVIGGFSSGKSTFVNALLADGSGARYLPSSLAPCTSVPTIVRFGPALRYLDANGLEVDRSTFESLVRLDESGRVNPAVLDGILTVEAPVQVLKRGVELVDCPGFNEDPSRTVRARGLIALSDAVVFLTPSTQVLSETDRSEIERQIEVVGRERAFLVVTGWDRVEGSVRDVTDLENRTHSLARDLLALEGKPPYSRVHFVSSTKRLEAAPPQGDDTSGFGRLELAISEHVAAYGGTNVWRGRLRQLASVLQDAHERILSAAHAIDLSTTADGRKAAARDLERCERMLRELESLRDRVPTVVGERAFATERDAETLISALPGIPGVALDEAA